MNILWLTDIHLNFLNQANRQRFYNTLKADEPDCLFITGDIAEAPTTAEYLQELVAVVAKPVYFVLGNHDYYQGEVTKVRAAMQELTKQHKHLFWLNACDPIYLDDKVIIGVDSWADGRFGDFTNSHVNLNDSNYIYDLKVKKWLGKYNLLDEMQYLANADANLLSHKFADIDYSRVDTVITLTHVPPFQEASRHRGEDYLPFYASKITGEVIQQAAAEYPDKRFLVLCGHVHHEGAYTIASNLEVRTGKAKYYFPEIQTLSATE